MKKIVFIMPSLAGGGAERVVSILTNYLSKKNYEVTVFFLRSNQCVYTLNEQVKLDTSCIGTSNGLVKKATTVRNIRNFMIKNRDAVFISFLTNENLYTTFAAIGLGVKVIVSERNDPYQTIRGVLNKYIVNKLYETKQCKRVVFQTEGAKSFYSKKIQDKGEIIANPMKEDLPMPYSGERRKEVVTFARLEPQKNFPLLIEAFELFLKKHSDYSLSIYGNGTMEEELKNLVLLKNLNNKVYFKGFTSSLHEKVRTAAMFVLPSDYEGLSNSMLEAMAIGLPCVCTDCSPGGARMYIDNGINGFLVPVKDSGAMCSAMDKIANNKQLSENFSKEATTLREKLSIEAIGEKWERIIGDI